MSHIDVIPLRGVMGPRDPREPGRVSTPLELLFDLIFVTAVASAGTQLHGGIIEGEWSALLDYLFTFFAIWWAWMNYTWFASAYARDDVIYRLLTFVIMIGALVLAAGVPGFFRDEQSGVVVAGYAIMRLGMASLWLRAARHDRARRHVALTYAAGITTLQVFWVGRLLVDGGTALVVTFLVLAAGELAVPYIAERRQHTPFHPEHTAERAGLLTIIVLGEVVLASVGAIQSAIAGEGGGRGFSLDLLALIAGAFLVVVSLWWLYFRRGHADLVEGSNKVWAFGYLHYFVFAGIAAAGAGITAGVEVCTHEAHAAAQPVAWVIAAMVSVCLLTLSSLHLLGGDPLVRTVLPTLVLVAVVLGIAAACPSMGTSVLLIGLALVVAVASNLVGDHREARA